MLYEIKRLKQSGRSQTKRWFYSAETDLFIWFYKTVPVRFQLAYNKTKNEQLISWEQQRGFHFYLVDSGENFPDQYKQSPLLNGLGGPRKGTLQ